MPICKHLNSINFVKNNYADRVARNVKSTGFVVMKRVARNDAGILEGNKNILYVQIRFLPGRIRRRRLY
jgi:hypothetical protein